jgi:hypothetical protein
MFGLTRACKAAWRNIARTRKSPKAPDCVKEAFQKANGKRGALTFLFEDWQQGGESWLGAHVAESMIH